LVVLTADANSFYGSCKKSEVNTGYMASVFGWGIEDQSKVITGDYAQFFKKDNKMKSYGQLKHDMNVMIVDRVTIEPK
jgi:hypothetical protein